MLAIVLSSGPYLVPTQSENTSTPVKKEHERISQFSPPTDPNHQKLSEQRKTSRKFLAATVIDLLVITRPSTIVGEVPSTVISPNTRVMPSLSRLHSTNRGEETSLLSVQSLVPYCVELKCDTHARHIP
jgi:hypothetical protein